MSKLLRSAALLVFLLAACGGGEGKTREQIQFDEDHFSVPDSIQESDGSSTDEKEPADSSCVPSCMGKTCGDNGCGGNCGTCSGLTPFCQNNKCIAQCTPSCMGKECGDNGCGGSCGTCPGSKPTCTDGMCVADCEPACLGKECGSDGCGGTCGTCPSGRPTCASGQCVADCTPSCLGKECGDNGCEGTCGTCPSGRPICSSGMCVADCEPACLGKECGDDGCGGICGTCPAGRPNCTNNRCVADCNGTCTARECGDDGCGNSCGNCPADYSCVDWQCISTQGNVIISEFMPDPAKVGDTAGEWIELFNAGSGAVDISGWTLADDGSDLHTISPGASLRIQPDSFIVLARNGSPSANGGIPSVAYVYNNFQIANTADEIVLLKGATEVDRVMWSSGVKAGRSISLDPSYFNTTGDKSAGWCYGATPYGMGDFGTPGGMNPQCF